MTDNRVELRRLIKMADRRIKKIQICAEELASLLLDLKRLQAIERLN